MKRQNLECKKNSKELKSKIEANQVMASYQKKVNTYNLDKFLCLCDVAN